MIKTPPLTSLKCNCTVQMSLSLTFFIALIFGIGSYGIRFSDAYTPKMHSEDPVRSSCPLNFDILERLVIKKSNQPTLYIAITHCKQIHQTLRLVQSEYLLTHGYFVPPALSSEACWASFQASAREVVPEFDVASFCGYHPEWISQTCMNVSSKSDFESLIPEIKLQDVREQCGQSLENISQCSKCIESLSSLRIYFDESRDGNATDCRGYPFIYAAALLNPFGPTNVATAQCLFSLEFSSGYDPCQKKHCTTIVFGAVTGCILGILGAVFTVLFITIRTRKLQRKKINIFIKTEASFVSELGHINRSINLVKYTYEEIKRMTNNFSRENIIGMGQYGNVYKGIVEDGTEVAVKRFKTSSISRDGTFSHEVEVTASVKHINLVSLRGYCTAIVPLEGYQRIIVCDLMPNGSLFDHLFGSEEVKKGLSWPIRQKIALGMARGLAYLHYGAQEAIIHRDIKASNILLDENFEAKVADFGLAKFHPKGMASHFSTRLAGTIGYVAPEYALYGKLTEGSDVYSFGVVLLELLSGKRAILLIDDEKPSMLTDWAWSMVRIGRGIDVVEENMSEVGVREVVEQYVFVAALCCHPCLDARPTMDQIVKLLERIGQVYTPSIQMKEST